MTDSEPEADYLKTHHDNGLRGKDGDQITGSRRGRHLHTVAMETTALFGQLRSRCDHVKM